MRIRKWIFSLGLIGLCCIACNSPSHKLNWQYSPQMSEKQLETAKKVAAIFEQKCAALKGYASTVTSASIAYSSPTVDYRASAYGWKSEYEVTLVIRDDAILPSKFHDAVGQTLRYYIGSGSSTGILTQKAAGAAFYGMQVKTDADSSTSDKDYSIASLL